MKREHTKVARLHREQTRFAESLDEFELPMSWLNSKRCIIPAIRFRKKYHYQKTFVYNEEMSNRKKCLCIKNLRYVWYILYSLREATSSLTLLRQKTKHMQKNKSTVCICITCIDIFKTLIMTHIKILH